MIHGKEDFAEINIIEERICDTDTLGCLRVLRRKREDRIQNKRRKNVVTGKTRKREEAKDHKVI